MKLIAIAAVDLTLSIGNADGSMPWPRLKQDMARFKETTMGHPIIMGRKTFATFKKPLPGRPHVVLTREYGSAFQRAVEGSLFGMQDAFAYSLEDAFGLLHNRHSDAKHAYVIGGAEIYRQFLPYCKHVYLTTVNRVYPGEVKFPMEMLKTWEVIGSCLQPTVEVIPPEKPGVEFSTLVTYQTCFQNPDPKPW